jgi:hypothetical protein
MLASATSAVITPEGVKGSPPLLKQSLKLGHSWAGSLRLHFTGAPEEVVMIIRHMPAVLFIGVMLIVAVGCETNPLQSPKPPARMATSGGMVIGGDCSTNDRCELDTLY